MSITDELRKYISGTARCGISPICEKSLANIADRIDAEHESACAEAYGNGVMSVPIALDESAWVKLPVDADGVPIHIGDELAGYGYPNGGAYCKAIVGEWGILAGEQDCKYQRWLLWSADAVRHYHAPTVEDVLREFTDAILEWAGKSGTVAEVGTWSDVAAEYAAKLKLAEGEDA